jgi:hypothetical protein
VETSSCQNSDYSGTKRLWWIQHRSDAVTLASKGRIRHGRTKSALFLYADSANQFSRLMCFDSQGCLDPRFGRFVITSQHPCTSRNSLLAATAYAAAYVLRKSAWRDILLRTSCVQP